MPFWNKILGRGTKPPASLEGDDQPPTNPPPVAEDMDPDERIRREKIIYLIAKDINFDGLIKAFDYQRHLQSNEKIRQLRDTYGAFERECDDVINGKKDSIIKAVFENDKAVQAAKQLAREIKTMRGDADQDTITTVSLNMDVRRDALEEVEKTWNIISPSKPKLHVFGKNTGEEYYKKEGHSYCRPIFELTQPGLRQLQEIIARYRNTGVENDLTVREYLSAYDHFQINGDSYKWVRPDLEQLTKGRQAQQQQNAEAEKTSLTENQRTLLLRAAEKAIEQRLIGGDEGKNLAKDTLEKAFFDVLKQKQAKGFFR